VAGVAPMPLHVQYGLDSTSVISYALLLHSHPNSALSCVSYSYTPLELEIPSIAINTTHHATTQVLTKPVLLLFYKNLIIYLPKTELYIYGGDSTQTLY